MQSQAQSLSITVGSHSLLPWRQELALGPWRQVLQVSRAFMSSSVMSILPSTWKEAVISSANGGS